MAIDQLPSGRFRARLMIDGVRWSETFATEQEARDWETVTKARAITAGLPKRISVRDYAARWMTTYESSPSSTRAFHQGNLDRHILGVLGSRLMAEVTTTDIARLLNDVKSAVSVATADAVYRTCSAMFNAAVADDVMSRSPVKSKKHRPKRQPEPPTVLERPQARSLLLQLSGWHRDTALLQLALGARIGEVAGLIPHDVDLAHGRVTIRRRYYRGRVRATKNHRLRALEIPVTTRGTFERLIAEAGDVEPLPPLDE